MKKIAVGILAHVDAGKTTLSEAMLYAAGRIRKLGRVDWRNTYLDTHSLERERGITIFSKQAIFESGDLHLTLLDTPGHVDFSAEAERTLSVLDYAVLVISGSEGVQAHTETLWHLLTRYRIPVFIFVTKMDLDGADTDIVMRDLTTHLSSSCVNFSSPDSLDERIALCDEELLDSYMSSGRVTDEQTADLIRSRKLFPCFFGSGLKIDGVDILLHALDAYTIEPQYPDVFSARVYKIGHDESGNRLTYCRITGGSLSVRQSLSYTPEGTDTPLEEKITGIRLYSGARYDTCDSVSAGDLCALTGLSATAAGQGLGAECELELPILQPVLNYRITLPKDVPPAVMLPKLRELEEEDPQLHIVWSERYGEIHVQVMGQVQTEVLTALILDRFGVSVTFDDGHILYKETITAPVEGVGHFEPLRHYAEVHLLMEPLPQGSGLVFDTVCSEDFLARNWQRLILTHLEEKQHLGVLTGSPITDMKLTLVSGRAHIKHTVGGDFREATYRAVREGLMFASLSGSCALLEPWYAFRLEIPSDTVGRAISDILARSGSIGEQETFPDGAVLTGRAPVSTICDYAKEVAAYSHGKGRFTCRVEGYFPCHNSEEVIAGSAYNPEADLDNTPDSVFCSHGAGVVVSWRNVPGAMHLAGLDLGGDDPIAEPEVIRQNLDLDEKELEAIMEREFGPIRRREYGNVKEPVIVNSKAPKAKKTLYVVDGYNVIFAWDELSAIAEYDLEGSRQHLLDLLANYQSFTGRDMVVVFDAYRVKGSVERKFDYHGLHVIYTKEGELGDTYIEKLINEIGRNYAVRVITSDWMIQVQALRSGVLRLSAREFRDEILTVDEEIRQFLLDLQKENEKK